MGSVSILVLVVHVIGSLALCKSVCDIVESIKPTQHIKYKYKKRRIYNQINKSIEELDVDEFADAFDKIKSFDNNFESQNFEITIAANTEAKLRHKFKGEIPKGMGIHKQTGNALVTDGDTAWTTEYVYIKNNDSTTSATLTLKIFLKLGTELHILKLKTA